MRLCSHFLAILLFLFIFSSIDSYAFLSTDRKYYVEKFGAVGDGKTDNSMAFRAISEAVNSNGGGIVIFPENGVFLFNVKDDPSGGHSMSFKPDAVALNFTGCRNVRVEMKGSAIKVGTNHSTRYALVRFFDCKSFRIKDGRLEGDAAGHDYSPVVFNRKIEKSTHEWGYGIINAGSSGLIENMDISYMTGDGIYSGSVKAKGSVYHSSVEISGCRVSYCRRNGITLTSSKGVKILNTSVHHIGSYGGLSGTNPQSGIDLEYEDGVSDRGNVFIDGCEFYECTRRGITASNTNPPVPDNFILRNSTFSKADVMLNNMPRGMSKSVIGCIVNHSVFMAGDADVEDCVFNLGDHITYISKTHFKDCMFYGTAVSNKSTDKGCAFAGFSLDKTFFDGCSFVNVQGNSAGNVVYQGFSGYVYPMDVDFDDCTFTNTSFCRGGSDKRSLFNFRNCRLEEGCVLINLDSEEVCFTDCTLKDVSSYVSQSGHFRFDHCDIRQVDSTVKHPLLLYGTHTLIDCTTVNKVVISKEDKKRGIKAFKMNTVNH